MTDTDTADLVRRMRVKADMLRMGEPIAFGSDADALEDAAEAIERLTRERDEARVAALEEAAGVANEFRGAKHAAHDIATGVFPKQSFMGEAIAAAIRSLKEPTHD